MGIAGTDQFYNPFDCNRIRKKPRVVSFVFDQRRTHWPKENETRRGCSPHLRRKPTRESGGTNKLRAPPRGLVCCLFFMPRNGPLLSAAPRGRHAVMGGCLPVVRARLAAAYVRRRGGHDRNKQSGPISRRTKPLPKFLPAERSISIFSRMWWGWNRARRLT